MLGEGVGSHEEIDRVCRLGGGFRMGPFELMDLIGVDVNFAVARSFYEQSFGEPRWRPHPIQARMVAAGPARAGRAGRGFYAYEGGSRTASPTPRWRPSGRSSTRTSWSRSPGRSAPAILGRIGAQIANEACFALGEGVASAEDIDTAMRLGFNWPLGPLEWGERLGWAARWASSRSCASCTARPTGRRRCCAGWRPANPCPPDPEEPARNAKRKHRSAAQAAKRSGPAACARTAER